MLNPVPAGRSRARIGGGGAGRATPWAARVAASCSSVAAASMNTRSKNSTSMR